MQFKVGEVEIELGQYDGANAMKVKAGEKVVYFSYSTPIAYFDGEDAVLNGKEYGKTTEGHKKAAMFAIAAEYNIMPHDIKTLENSKFHEVCDFEEPVNYKTKRAGDRE